MRGHFDARSFRHALGKLDPPLILWSCIKASRSCAVFESASHFAVNILASDQVPLSNQFASQQDDKFTGIDWVDGIGGAYSVVVSHPGTATKDEATRTPGEQSVGRLQDHTFYLMLMAIREYQSSYRPKMAALGLSVIESRVLLVLDDHPDIDTDELSSRTSSPVVEVSEALAVLTELGLITRGLNGYTTSPDGKAKADQCWRLADAHAKEAFANLSDAEMSAFKEVLRGMIEK